MFLKELPNKLKRKTMISVLCPSRGQPELAAKMVTTAIELAGADIEIILYLNDDDPKLQRYYELIDHKYITVGPDRSPTYSWNIMASQARYDYLFLIGHDGWFETEDWAPKIVKHFDNYPDKIAFVYPSVAGLQWEGGTLTEHHAPHFCIHKNWIRALGYFLPPQFYHWYVDSWNKTIAKMIGRYHIVNDVTTPLIVELKDELWDRKDKFCNREKDHWNWEHTQRWLNADAYALQNFIQNYK